MVVELARKTVDALTPEYVSYSEARRFDIVARRWSARRGSALDASSQMNVIDDGAVFIAVMAAQAAQDALREGVVKVVSFRVRRVVERWRSRRRNKSADADAGVGAGVGALTIESPGSGETSPAAQLRRVHGEIQAALVAIGVPEATAAVYAAATVGALAMGSGDDPTRRTAPTSPP